MLGLDHSVQLANDADLDALLWAVPFALDEIEKTSECTLGGGVYVDTAVLRWRRQLDVVVEAGEELCNDLLETSWVELIHKIGLASQFLDEVVADGFDLGDGELEGF